ncbi:MAG: fumarylacetoacetate hydrolase family protein [Pyrinomonadaceae bacterium]|nr:fumarylacetoacetate hydrolase family protein [Pyrinomonadaceae bacterium]
MKLYRTTRGAVVENDDRFFLISTADWDTLLNRDDLTQFLTEKISGLEPAFPELSGDELLAPIGKQEVWAAGVTYYRSRSARIEESKDAGGGSFYDRVYQADRPELFFKATPHRVVGHGADVRIRRDSMWNVPEPELTLVITAAGKIVGYTIGNDMSSRDIEGENPLYLPQAKTYDRSCALGPGILVTDVPLPPTTEIRLDILRQGETVFSGATALKEMKRTLPELVEFLYRESSFPDGCFLMTGTGVIPPDSFTLRSADEVRITIEPVGTLVNKVE